MRKEKYYKKINLVEDEEIIEIIRFNPWTKWHKFVIATILVLLPFFLMFYLLSLGTLGVSIFIALIVLAIVYIFREYYIWAHNVFVLTNQKIVDIDQRGLFSKTVSEVSYPKVLDVAYQSRGIWQSLFNSGSIMVKTSIPDLTLAIHYVRDPKNVNARLTALVERGGGRVSVGENNSAQKKENLEDFLAQDELAAYDQYNLKELIKEYVETYSKTRLKKLLADELGKDSSLDNEE